MADTAAFDTLATARKLKAAGIAEAHAEAIAECTAESARAGRSKLASKADIAALKADIAALKTDVKADIAGLEARSYRALLALGAALVGITVAVAAVAIGLMQALG